jgi:predicted dehydrogenase
MTQDPLVQQSEHFCEVIKGGERPRTTGEDAMRSLVAIRAVLTSAASGKPVELAHGNLI